MDTAGNMKVENIDWHEDFNELTTSDDPKLTKESYDIGLNRFCSYHITDLHLYHANNEMDK